MPAALADLGDSFAGLRLDGEGENRPARAFKVLRQGGRGWNGVCGHYFDRLT